MTYLGRLCFAVILSCVALQPIQAAELKAFVIGTAPTIDVAPIFVAAEKGFFVDAGLDATLSSGQAGPATIAGVISKSVQIGVATGVPWIQARSAGLKIQALFGIRGVQTDYSDSALVVTADGAIRTPNDLAGKIVAVNGLRNINELFVRADVDKHGADSATLKFIELPFPDMIGALEARRVDAIATTEPFLSSALERGNRNLLSYIHDIEPIGATVTYWFTSEQQKSENPSLFAAFGTALGRANEYANSHPDEVRQILATRLHIAPERLAKLTMPHFGTALDRKSFERQAELMVKYKIISKTPDLATIVP